MTNVQTTLHRAIATAAVSIFCAFAPSAHALFEDGEARKAILEARQRIDLNTSEVESTRRNMLDFNTRMEHLTAQVATLVGQNEVLTLEVQTLKQALDGALARLAALEPSLVEVDQLEFMASPRERDDYDRALTQFQAEEYEKAKSSFSAHLAAYPTSGYEISARFWLANSLYALQDCKAASEQYNLVLKDKEHIRVPDALLGLASCQAELKDAKSAKATLKKLVTDYPGTNAAIIALDRLKTR